MLLKNQKKTFPVYICLLLTNYNFWTDQLTTKVTVHLIFRKNDKTHISSNFLPIAPTSSGSLIWQNNSEVVLVEGPFFWSEFDKAGILVRLSQPKRLFSIPNNFGLHITLKLGAILTSISCQILELHEINWRWENCGKNFGNVTKTFKMKNWKLKASQLQTTIDFLGIEFQDE